MATKCTHFDPTVPEYTGQILSHEHQYSQETKWAICVYMQTYHKMLLDDR